MRPVKVKVESEKPPLANWRSEKSEIHLKWKWKVTFGKLVVWEVMATRGCDPGGLGENQVIEQSIFKHGKAPGVDCAPWVVGVCVWLGGRVRKTWGEGGSRRFQSPPNCRADHLKKDNDVKINMTRRMLLTIMLGVATGRYPLIGINREGVDCLCHWKYFRHLFFKYRRKKHFDKVYWGKI